MSLYDRIGGTYDTTRRADPYIASRLAHHLEFQPTRTYLDLACGTGNYTSAVANIGAGMVGIDRSPRMVSAARAKSQTVRRLIGDAELLPFGDRVFSGAICTLAVHHFRRRDVVFGEVFRVLRSGRFVLFTATGEQMEGYWLNAYFPRAIEASADRKHSRETFERELRQAGFRAVRFEPYEVAPDLQDFFLYSGKHRPKLYLDPCVRAGISTFAAVADPAEVQVGCERLARDIQSGRFNEVMAAYRHELGDYLFVIAEV